MPVGLTIFKNLDEPSESVQQENVKQNIKKVVYREFFKHDRYTPYGRRELNTIGYFTSEEKAKKWLGKTAELCDACGKFHQKTEGNCFLRPYKIDFCIEDFKETDVIIDNALIDPE